VENEWFTIPETNLTIGLDDPDGDKNTKRYFGWDNEKPTRSAHVKSFRAKARPITNGEYAAYLTKTGQTTIPASWCEEQRLSDAARTVNKRDSVVNGFHNGNNGVTLDITEGKYVKTVYGTVPLNYALDWPVVASFDEVAGCASWMGGRIPTMEEARSIYSYVDALKNKELQALGNTIPAVNGCVH
jgi:formylglycine-generating enzyme required for sulfatase activity